MFDTVNFWIDGVNISSGNPFEILPYLSDITRPEKGGLSGQCGDYKAYVSGLGISLIGSLPKNYYGDNLHTLTRKDTKCAIEHLSDNLHIDIKKAKVTRMDVSTVLQTKRPPCDYYNYLGQKSYFYRLHAAKDTLYYNNHQRQIVFYDKTKEANVKGVVIPEILQDANLLRYELRFKKTLKRQLKTDVTGNMLHDTDFYRGIIRKWYEEFKTIQKIKNQSFMTDNIKTVKDVETAIFATLLQKAGQSYIDDILAELKAKKAFNERQRYYDLKKKLNKMLSAPKGESSDLIKELEEKIFNVAKNAR